MLLQNLQPKKSHVKRARYIVESMADHVLFLHVVTFSHKGNHLMLSRTTCDPGDEYIPISESRSTQFPTTVNFAVTTSKSQSQSFARALSLNLCYKCFTHGQFYVAFSHTTHPNNMYVCIERKNRLTIKVVYTSILST